MKKLSQFWIFIFILFGTVANAQFEKCYENNVGDGKEAYKAGNYPEAINSYILARWCPNIDAKSIKEADNAISIILNDWVDSLDLAKEVADSLKNIAVEKQLIEKNLKESAQIQRDSAKLERKRAELQRDTAVFNSRLFYAYFVANSSIQENEAKNFSQALDESYHAYDTLRKEKIPVPPTVYFAFVNAVFSTFNQPLLPKHTSSILDFAFSEDGKYFYTIGRDKILNIWQYQEGKATFLKPLESKISKNENEFILVADFSPDGKRIAYGAKNGIMNIALLNDEKTPISLKEHKDAVTQVKWLPNGQLLTASRDGKLLLWDEQGKLLTTLIADTYPILDLVFSKNKTYALARTAKNIYHWETSERIKQEPILESDTSRFYTASLSPNGKMVLFSTSDNKVKVWENNKVGRPLLPLMSQAVLALEFAPNNTQFLAGNYIGHVQLWEKRDGDWKIFDTYPAQNKLIDQVFFSPNGKSSIATSFDTSMQLLSSKLILRNHKSHITHIDFSENRNDLVVSSSKDGTAKLWSADGTPLMNMEFENGTVVKSLFTKDGNYILSGTAEGQLFLIPTPEYIYQKIKSTEISVKDVRMDMKQEIEKLLRGRTN